MADSSRVLSSTTGHSSGDLGGPPYPNSAIGVSRPTCIRVSSGDGARRNTTYRKFASDKRSLSLKSAKRPFRKSPAKASSSADPEGIQESQPSPSALVTLKMACGISGYPYGGRQSLASGNEPMEEFSNLLRQLLHKVAPQDHLTTR